MKKKVEIRGSKKMKDHDRYVQVKKASSGSSKSSLSMNKNEKTHYRISGEGVKRNASEVINKNKALLKRLSKL